MATELASIVVRTKDRPRLLLDAVRSVAAQRHRPLELVLVNDGGSTVDRTSVAALLGDVELVIVELETNQGRAEAANVGLRASHGRYVGFLDDDDRLLPEHVALLVACLRGGEHRVCYSDAELCRRSFDADAGEFRLANCEIFGSRDFSYAELLACNYIPLMCLLFERSVLEAAGGFDPGFDLYEDWDLLLRVGITNSFMHVARVTAQYVQWSAEQQIAQSERTQSHQWQAYDRVIDRHRDKFSPEVARYMMRTVNHIKELEWKLGLAHGQLAERAARLEALERRLAELAAGQDSQTAELGALQQRNEVLGGELAAIKGSRAWQLVQRYGKWRQRLGLPGGHQ